MAKSAFHKVDFAGAKEYLILPRAVLESEAYRSLGFRARAALTLLHLRFNGFNNGTIALSARDMARELTKSHAQNLEALNELEDRGFIALEKDFPKVQRKAREYRLTFISSGPERDVRPATNDYLSWSREKSPVRVVRTGKPFPVRMARTDAEDVVLTARTDQSEKPNFANLSVLTTRTHIDCHTGGISPDPVNAAENTGGHFRAEPIRPQSMTAERWDMALKRARENPAGPDANNLRAKASDVIARIGRGTQRRIANAAGVSEPTFSKFLKGTTDLDNLTRIRVAEALPGLFANRSDAA